MGLINKSGAIRMAVALSVACANSLWSSRILLAEDVKTDDKKIKGAAPIAVTSVAGKSQITIRTSSSNPRYSVQRLTAPDRLVIDIEAERLPTSSSLKVASAPHLSAVRVGAHPEKTRVVVDLKGGADLVHDARGDGTSVVVSLSSTTPIKDIGADKKAVLAVDNSKQVKPAAVAGVAPVVAKNPSVVEPVKAVVSNAQPVSKPAKASSLALDEEVVVSGSSNNPAPAVAKVSEQAAVEQSKPVAVVAKRDEQPKKEPKLEIDDKPSAPIAEINRPAAVVPLNSGAAEKSDLVKTAVFNPMQRDGMLVTAVSLEEGSGTSSPALAIGLRGAPEYSMTRTAPSEYVVTLRNIKPAEGVVRAPLFAPAGSSGIRSVRTVVEGSNVLVRIFTQSSSYLSARRVGDRLLIEETQDLSRISRDIRAQIDPAAAKQSAEAEEAKALAAKKLEEQKKLAEQKKLDEQKKLEEQRQAAAKQVEKPVEKPVEKALPANKPGKGDNRPAQDGEFASIKGNGASYTGRLISLDLQDADIDSALRIIAEVSNLNIVAGDGVAGKVTLKLVDVPWDQALEVILKSHGLDKVLEGNVMRVAPVDKLKAERESFKEARVAEEELEPLSVKYMRVSYAKASEIKALVETVLSERGTVAFDERSNQLVVKDVRKGLQNVSELIKKVDLRTPQILLETQIVEASRNLSRELGSELGFQYIQSPATGNGTGLNFPSAIAVGGSADTSNPASILGSAFPIATSATGGSAVTMLFDSADGTKSLSLRLSQLEQEGRVRIVSKPAVATTNNRPAEIKSVEKVRIRLPNGGLSIASGSGATSSGSGDVATQTIEAGIILNVTPQASPDYYILLDIKAKSSSFSPIKTDNIPNEIERSASSSVLVSSGQTFALGGIYKLRESDGVTGVPFFKDIPVLGTFFRSITTENSDEELLFFITPRIVEGSFEDASMKVVS